MASAGGRRRRPRRLRPAAARRQPVPTSADVFVAIRDHVERHPELPEGRPRLHVQAQEPRQRLDRRPQERAGAVNDGESATADCTLELAESDFMAMTERQGRPA